MTENRHFAAWARTFAGLVALAGLIGLSGCGGGGGAPNNVFDTPGALTLLPNPLTLYSGTPATVTIAGGQPPYTIVSSDQVALPVQTNVSGSTQTVFPNLVATATPVTLTARDALGASTQSAVTINPAPLINSLKLKADEFSSVCPNPGGSASPTDNSADTFICSGQTGSVSVRLANLVGGGVAGRLVRFDVVQGAFQFFTELPGQTPTFALTYTVPTDVNGTAVARIRANPDADQQIVIVQATDVSTGAFVRGVFVIVKVVGGNATGMTVLPNTVTITGPDTLTCSSGASASYFIFGGQPPYTIVNSFPQFLNLSPTVVPVSGGGFTVTTLGACIKNATFIITDAAGHSVTATLTNDLGTIAPPTFTSPNPITVTPSTISPLACGAPTTVLASGGGTTTTTGNTTTVTPATSLAVAVSRPDVVTAVASGSAPPISITLTRKAPGPIPTPANVSLFISDGSQTKTVNIPIDTPGTPCP